MKNKVKFLNVSILTDNNKDGNLGSRLFIFFERNGEEYYAITDFLTFTEKKLLKNKYPKIDFDSVNETDITNNIQYVEAVKEENRYGVKQYLNVHFDIGYDRKINIENDKYFLIMQLYSISTNNNVSASANKK